ncbi:hypothetical protein FB561_6933 [Kribbella amoyensis]|uniref:Uncharacterized protein n=1 Tax=Kribbella amoyensis TaxID=996641 RepID=A0A561B2H0_9ACTN|nr:hypothetical protein FB561_6933 [Kribbella amoyensis]
MADRCTKSRCWRRRTAAGRWCAGLSPRRGRGRRPVPSRAAAPCLVVGDGDFVRRSVGPRLVRWLVGAQSRVAGGGGPRPGGGAAGGLRAEGASGDQHHPHPHRARRVRGRGRRLCAPADRFAGGGVVDRRTRSRCRRSEPAAGAVVRGLVSHSCVLQVEGDFVRRLVAGRCREWLGRAQRCPIGGERGGEVGGEGASAAGRLAARAGEAGGREGGSGARAAAGVSEAAGGGGASAAAGGSWGERGGGRRRGGRRRGERGGGGGSGGGVCGEGGGSRWVGVRWRGGWC